MKLYEIFDTNKQSVPQIELIIETSGLTQSIYNCVKRICKLYSDKDVNIYKTDIHNGDFVCKFKFPYIESKRYEIILMAENSIVADIAIRNSYKIITNDITGGERQLDSSVVAVDFNMDINDVSYGILAVRINFPHTEPSEANINAADSTNNNNNNSNAYNTNKLRIKSDNITELHKKHMWNILTRNNLSKQIEICLNSVLKKEGFGSIAKEFSHTYIPGRYRTVFECKRMKFPSNDVWNTLRDSLRQTLLQDENIKTTLKNVLEQNNATNLYKYYNYGITITSYGGNSNLKIVVVIYFERN